MSTEFPNEPSGFISVTNWPWNALSGGGWVDSPGDRAIVTDATAPLSPTNVLRSKRESGSTGGANIYFTFSPNVQEFFLGMWWKPNSPFWGWDNGSVNKFLHVVPASDGQIYMEFENGLGTQTTPNGPYQALLALGFNASINNCQLNSGFGDCPGGGNYNFFPNLGTFSVVPGEWHRVELYFKVGAGQPNPTGVIKGWRNNVLLFNKSNVHFPSGGFSAIGMTSIWDNGIFLPDPDIHYYDHTYISIPGSGPDTTPPNPPTGITVI